MQKNFFYNDWTLVWDAPVKELTVKLKGFDETRIYKITHGEITSVEQEGEYVFLRGDGFFYQFKFEEGNFFVGDIFEGDSLVEEVAMYVFVEH